MLGVMRAMVGVLPFTGNKIGAQPAPMTSERRSVGAPTWCCWNPRISVHQGAPLLFEIRAVGTPTPPHAGAGGTHSRAMSIGTSLRWRNGSSAIRGRTHSFLWRAVDSTFRIIMARWSTSHLLRPGRACGPALPIQRERSGPGRDRQIGKDHHLLLVQRRHRPLDGGLQRRLGP